MCCPPPVAVDSSLGQPLAFSGVTTPQDPENRPPQQPYAPAPPLGEPEPAGFTWSGQQSGPPPVAGEPRELRLSFWLWITAAVLLALSSLLVLTQRDAAVEAARRTSGTQGLSEEQFQSAVTASLVFLLIIGLVLGGLMAFFAFKARAGRGWARISLTVLGVVVFLYHLLGFSLLGLLIVLVVGAAVVTLYLPASKSYFDAVKRAG